MPQEMRQTSLAAPAPSWMRLANATHPDTRAVRVSILLIAVTIMGLADLAFTLNYVTTVGMIELNPIARMVMNLESPWAMVAWKLSLMVLSGGILFYYRRRRCAEVASWVCFLVLCGLTFQWSAFAQGTTGLGADYVQTMARVADPRFVVFLD